MEKVDFNTCLSKILAGEKIKIECNLKMYSIFQNYDKQGFISSDGKQEFLKLEGIEEFKEGEMVGVSDTSQEHADEKYNTNDLRTFYTKLDNGKFVCINDSNHFIVWNYISTGTKKEQPKFKIGDKVIIPDISVAGIICSIDFYEYNNSIGIDRYKLNINGTWYSNEQIRLATEEEINLYFN